MLLLRRGHPVSCAEVELTIAAVAPAIPFGVDVDEVVREFWAGVVWDVEGV